jgi:hypothetical protein
MKRLTTMCLSGRGVSSSRTRVLATSLKWLTGPWSLEWKALLLFWA